MTKKLISVIFALIFTISSFSVLSVTVSAANNTNQKEYPYKTDEALSYAAKNWNSGVGLCAEFVSRCIQAGGIDVFEPIVVNLYNALNGTHGTSYKLTLTNGKSGTLKMSDNEGKVGKGDPIFYYCNNCKRYTHAIICNGVNKDGYIQDYAHNKAHNGQKQTYTYYCCGSGQNWTMYSIVLDKGLLRYGARTTVKVPEINYLKNGANGVVVKWTAIEGAEKYNLYRKTDSTGWKRVVTTSKTAFSDKTISNNVKYKYTVRAIDDNVLSQYYDGKTVVSLAAPKLSIANNIGSVTVKWSKIDNADGYYVYRANEKGSWVKVATVKGTTTLRFDDKNVESGKTYKYTVRAYDGAVAGAYLNSGVSIMYLATPSLFKATETEKGVNITFKAVEGAQKYRVYRKAVGDKNWRTLGEVTTNSYTDNTVKADVTYIYTARALNENTLSNYQQNPVNYRIGKKGNVSQNEQIIKSVLKDATSKK
ncbi:MAG: hypothetical protein IJN49_02235 [Clostridia bacterium]|nr:hypothetical protein [Clostridia bacterium]